ncbi:inner membrane protein [Methanococcus voltae]|uniref:metal-dependent hydrolase n=1 Tax=Methanococcus voltae TaxID=2188 RepID=UPI001AE47E44|nr:metal-dependent hydrolase [Methanococcus voltae]MBP2143303.1 inner membrane protein [Methanococcus voltae]
MNWKGHVTLGIIMGLPFISSPEQIFLVVAGALYPDLDHDVKSEIVNRGLYIAGGFLALLILSYLFKPAFFNLDYFIAAILTALIYAIPYYADHRGLTHTFIAMILGSIALGYIVLKLSILSPIMACIIALIMVTNDKLLAKTISIAVASWIVFYFLIPPALNLQGLSHFAIPIFIGYLSHIVGDCVTPMGCKALYPLKRTLRRPEALIMGAFWLLAVIYVHKFL